MLSRLEHGLLVMVNTELHGGYTEKLRGLAADLKCLAGKR